MRFFSLITLLCLAPSIASAQETDPPDGTRISSVLISGLDISKLSATLRTDIDKLAGTPLRREDLRDLAARIEAERPRYITAVRTSTDPDGGARVIFVAAPIPDQAAGDVNAKYIVDDVQVQGGGEKELDPALQRDLRALVGKPLDAEAADQLLVRLLAAFPHRDVVRRTIRSNQRGHIKIVYRVERSEASRWLRFEAVDGHALFHSDQGWSAQVPLAIAGSEVLISPIIAWDTTEELIEEYSGFGVRVETRRLGTDRLGMSFDWTAASQDWRQSTLDALALDPRLPGAYRNRMSVTPLLKFAVTPRLSVAGGVGITELDPLDEAATDSSSMANAAIGSLRYTQRWGSSHHLGAALTLRAGRGSLRSDFHYDRQLFEVDYSLRHRRHRLFLSGMAGRVSGTAPLFERFALGDARTLRGWNKFDISPAGGSRMVHASIEYHPLGTLLFLDAGSVWDTGATRRVRFSAGFGFTPGPLVVTLGFPLNTDEFRAVFTMGFRFGRTTVGVHRP